MPLKRETCVECGRPHDICPKCGSQAVTPFENYMKKSPNENLKYDERSEHEYQHVCWDCGWKERIRVTVERTVGEW